MKKSSCGLLLILLCVIYSCSRSVEDFEVLVIGEYETVNNYGDKIILNINKDYIYYYELIPHKSPKYIKHRGKWESYKFINSKRELLLYDFVAGYDIIDNMEEPMSPILLRLIPVKKNQCLSIFGEYQDRRHCTLCKKGEVYNIIEY